jgi:hypothetical protein
MIPNLWDISALLAVCSLPWCLSVHRANRRKLKESYTVKLYDWSKDETPSHGIEHSSR